MIVFNSVSNFLNTSALILFVLIRSAVDTFMHTVSRLMHGLPQ